MTQAEALQKLTAISETLDKVKVESSGSLTKIDELKALLAQQGNLNPEVEAKINEIESKVKAVDDLIVDTPAETPGGPSEAEAGTLDNPGNQ